MLRGGATGNRTRSMAAFNILDYITQGYQYNNSHKLKSRQPAYLLKKKKDLIYQC
jgi:hypothetical protein